MTPAAIIQKAQADGVKLALSSTGTIKATGSRTALNRWRDQIRAHKAAIIDLLKGSFGELVADSLQRPVHYSEQDPLVVAPALDAVGIRMVTADPDAIMARPSEPIPQDTLARMTADEETAIWAWLALIEETDATTIAEVVRQCHANAVTREHFLEKANVALPKPVRFLDDRRTCNQCKNLIGRRCQAAQRGEIVASRTYEPIRDLLQRCAGYAPDTDDPDRRHGRERWPALIQQGGK